MKFNNKNTRTHSHSLTHIHINTHVHARTDTHESSMRANIRTYIPLISIIVLSPIGDHDDKVEVDVGVEVETEVVLLEDPSGDNFNFSIASLLRNFGMFSTCCTVRYKIKQ